jgi:hypothetical protein
MALSSPGGVRGGADGTARNLAVLTDLAKTTTRAGDNSEQRRKDT